MVLAPQIRFSLAHGCFRYWQRHSIRHGRPHQTAYFPDRSSYLRPHTLWADSTVQLAQQGRSHRRAGYVE